MLLDLRDAIVRLSCDCRTVGQQVAIILFPKLKGFDTHTVLGSSGLVESHCVLTIGGNKIILLKVLWILLPFYIVIFILISSLRA